MAATLWTPLKRHRRCAPHGLASMGPVHRADSLHPDPREVVRQMGKSSLLTESQKCSRRRQEKRQPRCNSNRKQASHQRPRLVLSSGGPWVTKAQIWRPKTSEECPPQEDLCSDQVQFRQCCLTLPTCGQGRIAVGRPRKCHEEDLVAEPQKETFDPAVSRLLGVEASSDL